MPTTKSVGPKPGNVKTTAAASIQPPTVHSPPTWDQLPAELKEGCRFVGWKYMLRDGKWTKPPYQTNGLLASSTNPETWATFPEVVAAYEGGDWDGIGIVLNDDGLAGIDLDHCIDMAGKLQPWAAKIAKNFGSYTEVSPSGEGVRIFVRVEPGLEIGAKSGAQEAYTHSRYLTLTGHALTPGSDVAFRHLEFVAFAATINPIKAAKGKSPPPIELQTGKVDPKSLDQRDRKVRTAVIKKMNGSAQKFAGDLSRVDMRLAALILAKVGSDILRADRIARSTSYYREKWDEPRGETTWFGHTLMNAVEAIKTDVEKLNAEYAVVSTGGSVVILHETVDPSSKEPTISLMGPADLRLWLKNRYVGDKPLAECWLASSKRRQYQGILFAPGVDALGFYNLWRGFPIPPAPGDCSKFLKHVEDFICKGNAVVLDYVLNWCAHLVQRPAELPEIALVLRGRQATGKGVFARTLGRLVGTAHSAHLTSMNQIVGHFNGHLAAKLLVFADEALWGGNRQSEGALKALITEPTIAIEPKGKDIFSVRNYTRLIAASNANWVVPLDFDDRRFLVLDVSDNHKEDAAYFAAIAAELNSGGLAALMKFLLERDLSNFNVRAMPKTAFGFDMKLKSAGSVGQWWHERLFNADALHWLMDVEKGSLHSNYLDWCKAHHVQHPETLELFSKELKKLVPEIEDYRPANKVSWQSRPRCFRLPTLVKCRASFQAITKCGPEIWEA